jgi:hypothetical protein
MNTRNLEEFLGSSKKVETFKKFVESYFASDEVKYDSQFLDSFSKFLEKESGSPQNDIEEALLEFKDKNPKQKGQISKLKGLIIRIVTNFSLDRKSANMDTLALIIQSNPGIATKFYRVGSKTSELLNTFLRMNGY